MCQNEGALNNETCMCDCADGYSGDNCESEYIVRREKAPGCKMPREEAKSTYGFCSWHILCTV